MSTFLQVHPSCGPGCDDTALNAIELVCSHPSRSGIWGTLISLQGLQGDWTPRRTCNPGLYVTAFRLDVEADQGGGDDSAANNLRVQCRHLDTATGQYDLDGESPAPWGSIQLWSGSCPLNSAVCGLKTKVQRAKEGADNTALNNVEMYCCK